MIDKKIFYHNFHLFFQICDRKEFEIFQLLENSKKKIVVMQRPVAKDPLGLGQKVKVTFFGEVDFAKGQGMVNF